MIYFNNRGFSFTLATHSGYFMYPNIFLSLSGILLHMVAHSQYAEAIETPVAFRKIIVNNHK